MCVANCRAYCSTAVCLGDRHPDTMTEGRSAPEIHTGNHDVTAETDCYHMRI